MKVSYQKNMKSGYMIMEDTGVDKEDYRIRMLENNHIPGLLALSIYESDGKTSYRYDISSKQNLKRVLTMGRLSAGDVECLIYHMLEAIDHASAYLIEAEDLLLSAEYIYMDSYTGDIYYVPDMSGDIQSEDYTDGLRDILRELPGAVDTADQDGIVLAYNLYKVSTNPNFTLPDLIKTIENYKHEVKNKVSYIEDDSDEDIQNELDSVLIQESESKPGLGERIKSFFSIKKNKEKHIAKHKETDTEEASWQQIWNQPSEETYAQTTAEPVISYVAEPDAYRSDSKLEEIILKGAEDEEDISVSYEPFIIGTQESVCDYILDKEEVDDMQIRIDKAEDGRYMVMDLNSKKGTSINGTLMHPRAPQLLSDGDRLELAGYEYTVSCPH